MIGVASSKKIRDVDSRSHFDEIVNDVVKGGFIGLGGQVSYKALSFILHIALARILGPYSYGLYVLGLTILTLLQRFSSLGLQNGVVRFGAIYLGRKDKARLKAVLRSSYLISLGSGIVFSMVLFSLSGFIATGIFDKPDLALVLKLFALCLPFYSLMMVSANSFKVFRKMEYEVITHNVFHPISTLFMLGIIFLLGYRLLGAIFAFISSSLLSAILAAYLLYKIFPEIISKIRIEYDLKELLTYSLTMLLLGFSYILLLTIDRIMIGFFGSSADVGIYNAASITAVQASIFLGSFTPIFLPSIAELSNQNRFNELENLLKLVTRWVFIFTLPLSVIFVLFSKEIMGIFGHEFRMGWTVLVVLSLAQLINASTGPVGSILTLGGRQKMELLNSSCLGLCNIILNIFLIPRYGILGAAIATASSLTLVNVLRLFEVYSFFKMHPYRYSYLKPILASLVAFGVWLLMDLFRQTHETIHVSGIFIFVITYLLTITLLGFDEEDKLVLQSIKRTQLFNLPVFRNFS